jgi:hypothetical protein
VLWPDLPPPLYRIVGSDDKYFHHGREGCIKQLI